MYSGTPRDLVVACDFAKALYGIVNGVPTWKRSYSGWPRAMADYGGSLYTSNGNNIHKLNPSTGAVEASIAIPSSPGAVNGISITDYLGSTWVIVSFDLNSTGSVRGYTMSGTTLTESWVCGETAANPRHAELASNGWVFVCDTFGHRVFPIAMSGNVLQSSHIREVYFPNHIQMLSSTEGLITAEHENRVIRWQYSPLVESLDLSAPVAPYNDITKTKDDIFAEEVNTADPNSTYDPRKSLCAEEAQGDNTLYSPNSCRFYAGVGHLVTDTDNGAVKIFDSGVVVTKIIGFNNPVNAILF